MLPRSGLGTGCPTLLTNRSPEGRPRSIYGRCLWVSPTRPPYTPLRRCFATDLLQSASDIRTVQELLGHADVVTTMTYSHVLKVLVLARGVH